MRGRSTRTPRSDVGPEACPADWRRPGDYRFCGRPAGHRGRHHLVAARPEFGARRGALGRLADLVRAHPPLVHH
jgi:hypothetical protein